MKRCPKCYRRNENEAQSCVLCHESLSDVEAVAKYDPVREAEEWAANHSRRASILRQRCFTASLVYLILIDLLAVVQGLVFRPIPLLLYSLSAAVTAIAICRFNAGQFTACALQGGMSLALLFAFNAMHPFIFFMMLGHIVLAMFLYHWISGLHDLYR